MNLKSRREQQPGKVVGKKANPKTQKIQEKKAVQVKAVAVRISARNKAMKISDISEKSLSLLTVNLKESELDEEDIEAKLKELEEEFAILEPEQPKFHQVTNTIAQGERLFSLLTENDDRSDKFIKPLLFDEETEVNYESIYNNADHLLIWEAYYGKEYSEYLTAGTTRQTSVDSQRLTTPVKTRIVNDISAMSEEKIDINMLLSTAAKIESETKETRNATCLIGSQIYRGCVCKRRMPKMVSAAMFKRHPDLGWNMRILVVDWMKEFAANYKVKRSTYHLAVAILDKYLQTAEGITRDKLQFIAAICLILASKYDDSVLSLADMSFLSTRPSTMPDAKALEFTICKVDIVLT